MNKRLSLLVVLALLIPARAWASFHLMQIEQVIGGVNGNTNAQAIQLRMRSAGQNQLGTNAIRLVARNAAGLVPVTLVIFGSNPANSVVGTRVLIASAGFAATQQQPPVTPDFTMTSLIPASYLAAGSLTFEDSIGNVLWRVSWGGAGYTGSQTGTMDNDANGDFSPPFASALPSGSNQALKFNGLATDVSTTNAAQYSVTAGNAVFNNNAGATGTVPVELIDLGVE